MHNEPSVSVSRDRRFGGPQKSVTIYRNRRSHLTEMTGHALPKSAVTMGRNTHFIRATEKLRIYLPLGTYVLKTTTGRQWYGDQVRFGPDASFSRPNETFPLNKPGEYWEVELILQEGGNLSQSAISEAEFGAD